MGYIQKAGAAGHRAVHAHIHLVHIAVHRGGHHHGHVDFRLALPQLTRAFQHGDRFTRQGGIIRKENGRLPILHGGHSAGVILRAAAYLYAVVERQASAVDGHLHIPVAGKQHQSAVFIHDRGGHVAGGGVNLLHPARGGGRDGAGAGIGCGQLGDGGVQLGQLGVHGDDGVLERVGVHLGNGIARVHGLAGLHQRLADHHGIIHAHIHRLADGQAARAGDGLGQRAGADGHLGIGHGGCARVRRLPAFIKKIAPVAQTDQYHKDHQYFDDCLNCLHVLCPCLPLLCSIPCKSIAGVCSHDLIVV